MLLLTRIVSNYWDKNINLTSEHYLLALTSYNIFLLKNF